MHATNPHYLLFSSADAQVEQASRWQFVLESIDGTTRFAAADDEPSAPSERAELLAVVRGLEALEQPSRVTLVTPSRYVSRGICRCLDDWRADQWRWERFGRLEPIRDQDLWQRVDRALSYHRVDCHTWPASEVRGGEISEPDQQAAAARGMSPCDGPAVVIVKSANPRNASDSKWRRLIAACDRLMGRCVETLGTGIRCLSPVPRSA